MARRIFLYLTGVFFGSVIVFFLFGDKIGNMFPERNILNKIISKEIIIDKKTQCFLSCYQIDSVKKLLDDADVLFSESSPREKPQKYIVEFNTSEGEKIKLGFQIEEKTATVYWTKKKEEQINCNCE